MYIVVSNDPRTPFDLKEMGKQVEHWTTDEFLVNAGRDDGLSLDEGLYYNASDLSEDVYEALKPFIDYGKQTNVEVIFYQFDDSAGPDFNIVEGIKMYKTINPEPVPEPEIEKPIETAIEEIKEPEPVPEPVKVPEPEPIPAPVEVPAPEPIPEPVPAPKPEPIPEPAPVQPTYVPPVPQNTYTPPVQDVKETKSTETTKSEKQKVKIDMDEVTRKRLMGLLANDPFDSEENSSVKKKKKAPAKVILFGSSKGGTGKTFTCLSSAYWYAQKHPKQSIALADFDIIDGQIGITINKLNPTILEYYSLSKEGRKDFAYFRNNRVLSENFPANIDFYLAPFQDIPKVTNDVDFWNEVFENLIANYDVVFFDTGIDYLGKVPINRLYKIADKIIITSNPSINSTKSVIKQFKTLSGERLNNVFRPSDKILSRTGVVLTRVYDNEVLNNIVKQNLSKFAPILAEFGNIDNIISDIQWYQHWNLIDSTPIVNEQLSKIIEFIDRDSDDEDE